MVDLQPPQKLQRWLDAALSDEEIGGLLREHRAALGISTEELASEMYLTPNAVRYREIGRKRWTPGLVTQTLAAIERVHRRERPQSKTFPRRG